MAIPKYDELYRPVLLTIKDGKIHDLKEIKNSVKFSLNLTDEELSKQLPSGKQSVVDNRIAWALQYLKKAGIVDTPQRARYLLTEIGKDTIENIDNINNDYLKKFESFRRFKTGKKIELDAQDTADKSPDELLEDAFSELNESLADDLMTEIMKLSPTDFEKLVVKLLLKMGYGYDLERSGQVTQASNDGGIDGIIKEDKLGFSFIGIQAKHWALENSVNRPEIQKFAGALQERSLQKGLFITTASFTSGAIDSAKAAGIILVDGEQLTKLMIEHNLGVSINHIYEVKSIDTDFFAEGF